MATQGQRKLAAVAALADSDDPAFEFTGRSFTVAQLSTYSRSEAALHRWDVAGDDDLSDRLLTQAELTRHAVDVLNSLPSLHEAPAGAPSTPASPTGCGSCSVAPTPPTSSMNAPRTEPASTSSTTAPSAVTPS